MKNPRLSLTVFALTMLPIAIAVVIVRWNAIPTARAQSTASSVTLPPAQTVELREVVWKAGARPSLSFERTLAIRADGSLYQYDRYHRLGPATGNDAISAPGIAYSQTLLSLKGGIRAEIANEVRTMSVIRGGNVDARRRAERWDPGKGCAVRFDGYRGSYSAPVWEHWLGFEVVKLVEDDQAAEISVWRAPALGCTELRRLAEFRGPDGRITEESELRAVSVVVGEPDSRLWQIPADFENVPFSEKLRRQAAARGGTVDGATLALLGPADQAFRKARYDGQ